MAAVVGFAYLATLAATLTLVATERWLRPRSYLLFGLGGLGVGIVLALLLDLPSLNLTRGKYYVLAAAAGACTGLAYRAILRGPKR